MITTLLALIGLIVILAIVSPILGAIAYLLWPVISALLVIVVFLIAIGVFAGYFTGKKKRERGDDEK